MTNVHSHPQKKLTYEVKNSKTGRSVFITTSTPPDEWTTAFIDRSFQATDRSAYIPQTTRRRVHFTPPQFVKEKIIISVVDSKPHVPPMPSRFRFRSCIPFSSRRKIFFYDKHNPFYGFTNFSAHPVKYEGKVYPTSEHLFQSLKFSHKPHLAEYIRTCSPSPRVAFEEAHRLHALVRSDWNRVNIQVMDVVLWNKFVQHKSIRHELLSTGDAELIEDSTVDAFWGLGPNGRGRNELGKALERLRQRFQAMK